MEEAGLLLSLPAGLSQLAALYREDEMIDAGLEAVASQFFEILGRQAKRRVRPLFNGVQIRRNRLEGVAQSPQIRTEFVVHGRHRSNGINQLMFKDRV
jgi:hypothetical protein